MYFEGIKSMTKKLTLNRTWKLCLAMWKWITETWKPGMNVYYLKGQWLQAHDYEIKNIISDCFFCNYDVNHRKDEEFECSSCPGKLVSKRFNCCRLSYCHNIKPLKFYKKLLQLDAKRKSKIK